MDDNMELNAGAADLLAGMFGTPAPTKQEDMDFRLPMKYKKLDMRAKEPTQGSKEAAGYDLYGLVLGDELEILPHTTVKIGTGIAIELPPCTFGAIFARSGLATKQGLRPANCVGVIDSDYRGEVIVALHNDTNQIQVIHSGDRIAQLTVLPYMQVKLVEAEELSDSIRGNGGFGSTGV